MNDKTHDMLGYGLIISVTDLIHIVIVIDSMKEIHTFA